MSTTAIVNRVPENGVLATADDFGREKVELLKRTVCKDASDSELELFVHVCKRTGLDPFARQIHAVKRWQDGREVMTIQTGIDGYRLIADRTGKYSPGREPSFGYDAEGRLISATAYVKKQTADGTWHEVSATAHYDEYVGLKKDGSANMMWRTKPHIMLSKCAEALTLRRAFPAELSGVYTKEEMDQADNDGAAARPSRQSAPPPDVNASPEFSEQWIAAMGVRGFSAADAGKVLAGMLHQKGKTIADLDGAARANLIRLAMEGKYDAYLRKPQQQVASDPPALPAPAPTPDEVSGTEAEPPEGRRVETTPPPSTPQEIWAAFIHETEQRAMESGLTPQQLAAGMKRFLLKFKGANGPTARPWAVVPMDARRQCLEAISEKRGYFAVPE